MAKLVITLISCISFINAIGLHTTAASVITPTHYTTDVNLEEVTTSSTEAGEHQLDIIHGENEDQLETISTQELTEGDGEKTNYDSPSLEPTTIFQYSPATQNHFPSQHFSIPDNDPSPTPECLTSEGTQSNWNDDSCKSYVTCHNSIPSLLSCPDGHVFSVVEGGCVTRTIFDCHITNRAMKVAGEAISFLRGSTLTEPVHRVRRSSGIEKSSEHQQENDTIAIFLPPKLCQLISGNTDFLETNLNNLLKLNTNNCPGTSCKVPLVSFRCDGPEQTSDHDDDDYDDDIYNDDSGSDDENDNDYENAHYEKEEDDDYDDADGGNDDDDDVHTSK